MSDKTKKHVMGKAVDPLSKELYEAVFDTVNDPDDRRELSYWYEEWGDMYKQILKDHLADIIKLKSSEKEENEKYSTIKEVADTLTNCVLKLRKSLSDSVGSKFDKKNHNEIFGVLGKDTIRSWIATRTEKPDGKTKPKQPGDRSRICLYMISFAYDLPYDENWNTEPEIDENEEPVLKKPQGLTHQYLFSHLFRMKPLIETPLEFCLTYCKYKKLGIKKAYEMYFEYLNKESESGNKTVGGTKTLFAKLFEKNEDEFIDMLCSTDMTIKPLKAKEKIKDILVKKTKFDSLWSLAEKDDNIDSTYNTDSTFIISFDSAFDKSSGKTGNIIQLRKIFILSFYEKYWFHQTNKEPTFMSFINWLDHMLVVLNLPELYILDDFDRAVIIAAAAQKPEYSKYTVHLDEIIRKVVPEKML